MNNLTKNLLNFRSTTFAGGLATGIAVDLFSDHIHRSVEWVRSRIINRYSVSMTIEDSAEVYDWINFWFHSSKYCDLVNNLSVGVIYGDEKDETGRRETNVMLTPGPGSHLIRFDGAYFLLSKSNDSLEARSGKNSGVPRERDPLAIARIFDVERKVITLKCLRRDKDKLLRFLDHTKDLYFSSGKKQSIIYQHRYGDWYKKKLLMPRTIESLILDDDILEDMIREIQWFLENKSYHWERGMPYRLGFLLYGPPGTGKTSAIIALANYFNIDVYYIDIGASHFDDSYFVNAVSSVPHNSFLVIEEIDLANTARKNSANGNNGQGINKGTLMNCIDGLFASEGRVLFMTTNNKDKVDEAILRPGRCDKHIYFGYASKSQIQRMIKRFFPDSDEATLNAAVSICQGRDVSPALLQLLLKKARHKDDAIQILAKEFGRKPVLQCGAGG